MQMFLLSIPNTLAALEAALSQSKEGFSEEVDHISRSFSKFTSLNFNCNLGEVDVSIAQLRMYGFTNMQTMCMYTSPN